MRKLFSTLGLALSLTASPASAADWLYVTTTVTDARWYVDLDTYQKTGDRVVVWVKIDFSRDKTVAYREEKRKYRIDCAKRAMKILAYTEYNADGTVRSSNSYSDYSDVDMQQIPPESVGDDLIKFVCS